MTPWLRERLRCPYELAPLSGEGDELRCAAGHRFPVVQGVPVLLRNDVPATFWVAERSLALASARPHQDERFLETVGVNEYERQSIEREFAAGDQHVDPVVRYAIAATSGILYRPAIGRLREYPIPDLRLSAGSGPLLDVGCSWGRWTIAAARKGYRVVGVDPSLGAVLAAQRVCQQLQVAADFVVADARYLPLADDLFQVVFSYSVLQHFSKDDARRAFDEIARVLNLGGMSFLQMPHAYGLRSLYHLARRRGRPATNFEVRYWTPRELEDALTAAIGPSRLEVDGFFGLGIQPSDAKLFDRKGRLLVRCSEWLRRQTERLPLLTNVADSLYVESRASAG